MVQMVCQLGSFYIPEFKLIRIIYLFGYIYAIVKSGILELGLTCA
jgi:hypothetical protein